MQQSDVAGRLEILAHGLEIPQRGIHRIVCRRFARSRKLIGQHAVTHEAGIRSQDVAQSHGHPVARHNPGSAIIVSQPQSLNQGYPARMDFASSAPSSGRAAMNWSAARTSCCTATGGVGCGVPRCCPWVCSGETVEKRARFALALRKCGLADEGRRRRRARHNRERISRRNRRPKLAREKVVRAVRKPALPLDSEIEIAVPVPGRRCHSRVTQQIKRRGALGGHHLQSMLDFGDFHGASPPHCHTVLIAIIREHFDRQFDGSACAHQPV